MKRMSVQSVALSYKLSKYNSDPTLLWMTKKFHSHRYFLKLFNCIFKAISIFE